MFIEIRKQGKKEKYYLIHSYRIGEKVKRISRFLGSNLSEKELNKLKKRAEELILHKIKDINPFELTEDDIKYYRQFDAKVKIVHMDGKEWQRFTEEFTYNTNAIEGSAVLYEEVKKLIEHKEIPKNSEEKEAINVAKAVSFIKNIKEVFSSNLVEKLHKLCFDKTKKFAGRLRDVEVVIKDSLGNIVHRGAPKKDIKKLLNKLVSWYNKHKRKYPPLYLAAIVHNQFEKIHPFEDGNGRVGRLLLNYILIKNKYPPINILLKDRKDYYETLQKFDKTGDIKKTLHFLIYQYKEQYKGVYKKH